MRYFALGLAAVVAQTLDLLTIKWETEANPFVRELGPIALILKVVLIVYLGLLSLRVQKRTTAAVLALATVVGVLGVLTNGVG